MPGGPGLSSSWGLEGHWHWWPAGGSKGPYDSGLCELLGTWIFWDDPHLDLRDGLDRNTWDGTIDPRRASSLCVSVRLLVVPVAPTGIKPEENGQGECHCPYYSMSNSRVLSSLSQSGSQGCSGVYKPPGRLKWTLQPQCPFGGAGSSLPTLGCHAVSAWRIGLGSTGIHTSSSSTLSHGGDSSGDKNEHFRVNRYCTVHTPPRRRASVKH